jgi:hypothetical protein
LVTKRVFSELYLQKGDPLQDSQRFRKRLESYVHDDVEDGRKIALWKAINKETGADLKFSGSITYSAAWFFQYAEMRDVLDGITYLWRILATHDEESKRRGVWGVVPAAPGWLKFVERVFREENLRYTVDNEGVVHYHLDAEFQRTANAPLMLLENPRYGAVRAEYLEAFKRLDASPPDMKEAVRRLFEANEIAFKLLIKAEGKARLTSGALKQSLGKIIQAHFASDTTALRSSENAIQSFAAWVDAVHWYRHGQAVEEPMSIPMDFGVLLISQGTAFLRWQLTIDQIESLL